MDRGGNITFENGNERRHDAIWGVGVNNSNMTQEELNTLYNRLNQYLNQYLQLQYLINHNQI